MASVTFSFPNTRLATFRLRSALEQHRIPQTGICIREDEEGPTLLVHAERQYEAAILSQVRSILAAMVGEAQARGEKT